MLYRYKITPPNSINTEVSLPPSKSISNRAIILNALSLNPNPVSNLSDCEDTQVILDVFNSKSNVFDVKGAGTAMRFLTAFLAGMEGEWILKGSERMHQRPIHPLVETLVALGANITYLEKEGFPPLKIVGKNLKGGEVYLSGNISSQFISALLMVAPLMEKGLTMHIETEIVSRPYIEQTIEMMSRYGVNVKWTANKISVKHQAYKASDIVVETDWSSASYWYEIASLLPGSKITLKGLVKNSIQGDSKVATLFNDLGVSTEFKENSAVIKSAKKKTKKFFHDFVNEPDLVQTFVAACCFKNVEFLFSGIQSLKIKETDRVQAMITEMRKFGYVLKENGIGMLEWDGERCVPEAKPIVATYDDHRMAMSLAPGAIVLGDIMVDDPRVVAKSYPNFWEDLEFAGFKIDEIEIKK